MAAKQLLVDTNVLVRFFTGDPPELALRARRLVERADNGELTLVIVPVIAAETFFTLESYYKMGREDVAAKLLSFIQSRGIQATEPESVVDALQRCRDQKAHFADAYLAAVAAQVGTPVASFDRDFDKFKDVKRIEPRG